MQLRCEDLPQAGIILIPHGSPEFPALLADITRCIESPPPGGPPPFPNLRTELPDPDDPASAILWNQSGKPICASTRIWKPGGTTVSTAGVPSLLLPFGLRDDRRAFETYWRTILPNSKRWLNRGRFLGSNADVRPPAGDEIWVGGVMGTGGGVGGFRGNPGAIALAIDAVFFATGECAGPDTWQLWEQTVLPARMYQQAAAGARKALQSGLDTAGILAAVEQITGKAVDGLPRPPVPFAGRFDAHDWHERARQEIARRVADMRRRSGDEKTVATLNDWADAQLPEFRRI